MLRWIEIAREPSHSLRFLSEFLNERGVGNEVQFVQPHPDDFTDRLTAALSSFDAIRVGSPFREIVLRSFTRYGDDMYRLKAADSLVKADNAWWPKAVTPWGFEEILRRAGIRFDLEGAALIVGAGAGARFASSVLIKMGMKRIHITNKFADQAYALIQDLRRTYFDVDFEFITQDRLVLLPGSNVVVVNTTPLVPENDLLGELYYFNFLRASGVVIDMTIVPTDPPLVQEARTIGIKVIRGYQIAACADIRWAEIVTGRAFDIDAYTTFLEEKIKTVPFDLSPFLESV